MNWRRKTSTSCPVHISSGLSGTFETARRRQDGAGGCITVIDTFTLSGAEVAGGGRRAAAQAGWTAEQIVKLTGQVRDASRPSSTLPDLKYLIHGGRISHIKGLLASILNIKLIIGVAKRTVLPAQPGAVLQRGVGEAGARGG